jgi:hypothetical protein
MSIVTVEDGRVVLPAAGSIELPTPITADFLDAVFRSPIGDPGHIAELHQYLSADDKQRFEEACTALNTEQNKYVEQYAVAAVNWASVAEADGIWKLRDILYSCDIHSWLIDMLHVDMHGFWYAVKAGSSEIISAAEFEVLYGDTIPEHLRKQLDFYPVRINQALDAMESKWVGYSLTISRGAGIVTVRRRGPPNIHPKDWKMRSGDTFISSEPL